MSSRFRVLWSKLCRTKINYRCSSIVTIQKNKIKHVVMPCTLSFSLFTWMGFEKTPTGEDELVQTIKHCVLFIQRSEYDKAEQLLHVALRQAQQIEHHLGITYIYDVMANLALEREQLEKAKKLFIAVTQRIMANGAKEDDFSVIQISVKLARISHLKKDYSTAQLGYDWCLEKLNNVLEQKPTEETKKLLAITEDWYGRLFIDCNQYENGLRMLLRALQHMKEVSDVEKEHIVIQLNDIGTVYDKMGKADDSVAYFKEAIDLGKEVPDMDNLGAMYVNLGRAYMKKNLLDDARKNCGFGWKLGVDKKNNDIKLEAEKCINEIKYLA